MGNIASIRSKSGDLTGALKIANESLSIARTSSTEGAIAESLSTVAAVEQMSGDLKQAQTHAQESLDMERKIGDVPSLETALSSLGDTFAAQGNLGEARKYYDEALDLARKSNANGTVAEFQHSLAELSLDQGHAGEAETLLIQALKEFEAEQAMGKVLPVQIALARTLLREGKIAEARNLATDAAKTARIAPDYPFLLDLSALRAQVDAAGGKSSAAKLATEPAFGCESPMPARKDTSKLPRRHKLRCWKSSTGKRPRPRSLASRNSRNHVGPEVISQSQTAHPLSWQRARLGQARV
jgi:ATP/maltotriose-dependent transcriptional regulator MalT